MVTYHDVSGGAVSNTGGGGGGSSGGGDGGCRRSQCRLVAFLL